MRGKLVASDSLAPEYTPIYFAALHCTPEYSVANKISLAVVTESRGNLPKTVIPMLVPSSDDSQQILEEVEERAEISLKFL
jgi:hypothetical protein